MFTFFKSVHLLAFAVFVFSFPRLQHVLVSGFLPSSQMFNFACILVFLPYLCWLSKFLHHMSAHWDHTATEQPKLQFQFYIMYSEQFCSLSNTVSAIIILHILHLYILNQSLICYQNIHKTSIVLVLERSGKCPKIIGQLEKQGSYNDTEISCILNVLKTFALYTSDQEIY